MSWQTSGRVALLAFVLGSFLLAPPAGADVIADSPARRLELRQRMHEFGKAFRDKRSAWEDKWIASERGFIDEMRKALRDAEAKYADEALAEPDWSKARRDQREKKRKFQQELRQRVRVHREELELELIQTERKLDAELRDFVSAVETELKEFKKEQGYSKALQDFGQAREELKEELRNWKTRMKNLKPKEAFWE